MSAILSADDLNDFITPGVACIKPIETVSSDPAPGGESLEHEVILDGAPGAVSKSNKPAQISLTDCLACSGCVTSAEAVLVSLQSHAEVLSVLDSTPPIQIMRNEAKGAIQTSGLEAPSSKILVASIAPQVLASLAAVYNLPTTKISNMLTRFLVHELKNTSKQGTGFSHVVSTEPANGISLHLSALEVLSPSPTRPKSFNTPNGKPVGTSVVVEGAQKSPLLASACPGWVCYAEKTHPYVLPHLSRVKSPQALTGVLLKSMLARKLGVSPNRIWHLAIMPCFDKKLEAAREELTSLSWWDGHTTHEHQGFRDVDCVITSKEILLLAQERGIDFASISAAPVEKSELAPFPDRELSRFLMSRGRRGKHPREAGSSGGMLHHILHRAAAQHAGSKIITTRGRNADVVEYSVQDSTGITVLKAARFYGFRNIQNLVRKLKPAQQSRLPGARKAIARKPGKAGAPAGGGKLDYAYVEVMACPGGCTNGGGQVQVDDQVVVEKHDFGEKAGVHERKAWLGIVDEAYFSASEDDQVTFPEHDIIDGISPSYVQGILKHWASTVGVGLDEMAFTSFREVVSDVGKEVDETERVVQLAGKIGGGW